VLKTCPHKLQNPSRISPLGALRAISRVGQSRLQWTGALGISTKVEMPLESHTGHVF
jgi:hypothetical protein